MDMNWIFRIDGEKLYKNKAGVQCEHVGWSVLWKLVYMTKSFSSQNSDITTRWLAGTLQLSPWWELQAR